jgi:hypothetical protein
VWPKVVLGLGEFNFCATRFDVKSSEPYGPQGAECSLLFTSIFGYFDVY